MQKLFMLGSSQIQATLIMATIRGKHSGSLPIFWKPASIRGRSRISSTIIFLTDRMRLLGYSLNEKMVILPEYQTAYIYLSKSELASYNYVKGDTEGFVNMPLSINGVVFSVLFIEKEGFVKLSFRSKGTFPVNEFASRFFYGGGHLNASGGEYPDTLENTIAYFLKILKENFGTPDTRSAEE